MRGRPFLTSALSISSRFVLSSALLVLAAGCSSRPSGPPGPEELTLGAADGFRCPATFYPVTSPNPPGVILLAAPAAGSREAWRPFALRAQRQGYASLAVEIRAPEGRLAGRASHRWDRTADVAGAAKQELLRRGADADNLAIAGAGVTANLALTYAATDPAMQAIILLSPGLEYDRVNIEATIREIDRRPVFIAVMDGDAYAHSSSLQLHGWSEGYSELRVYRGATHGTDMLSTPANVAEQILLWLGPILIPQRPGA